MVLNRSWGARGHPFAQHSSCPIVLRCSIGSTVAAFLGTIFVWERLPQSRRAVASAIPALNRQGGNVRVAAPSAVVFPLPKRKYLLHRSLWSGIHALPPLSGPMILTPQVFSDNLKNRSSQMLDCLAVTLGGAAGSVLRYLIGLIPVKEQFMFPIKTFAINVLGCFVIGLVTALALKSSNLNTQIGRAHV